MPEKPRFTSPGEKRVEPLDSALRLSEIPREEGIVENPEDRLNTILDGKKFFKLLKEKFPPREFAILIGHGIEGKTFEELGKEFDISGNRAMQIYNKTLERAQHLPPISREYNVKHTPKEVVYLSDEDEEEEEKRLGREQLDKLAELLLGEDKK